MSAVEKIIYVPVSLGAIPALDGDTIVLRRACEILGLDYSRQLKKLKAAKWANVAQRAAMDNSGRRPGDDALPSTGRIFRMVTVDRRTFLMWLAGVQTWRIKDGEKRVLIEAFQAEAADALDAYFGAGAAYNPRASADQIIQSLPDKVKERLGILQLARGLCDPGWLDMKARHQVAVGLGEEPDTADVRLLTVDEYLESRGVPSSVARKIHSEFGKRLIPLYEKRYGAGKRPGKSMRVVDGAEREVNAYTDKHRDLFDAVFMSDWCQSRLRGGPERRPIRSEGSLPLWPLE